MVGGSSVAWQRLRPLLEPVAARAEGMATAHDATAAHDPTVAHDRTAAHDPTAADEAADDRTAAHEAAAVGAAPASYPCVDHIGADGAGHFVKMVHNGIEYADMQLIAEAFTL